MPTVTSYSCAKKNKHAACTAPLNAYGNLERSQLQMYHCTQVQSVLGIPASSLLMVPIMTAFLKVNLSKMMSYNQEVTC